MSSVGKISLDLNVNSKGFDKQVDGIEKQAKKSFGMLSVAVGNIIANMAEQALRGIGNFVTDSINKGSELSELQNVVDSVFTSMADNVDDFAKGALENFGLNEAYAKKMVGTYGAMSKSFGYTEAQAYEMSTALAGLTGDVASFYNLDHDQAYTKLKSVFTGETESLKELGVVMTQAALDQFALANGFGKTTKNMSEQEKVSLRLAFVQDKLNVASGDFLKTQDQWANQTRILSGQFDSLKAALGQGFINVLTPVIRTLNTLMAKLVQAANLFKDFTAMIMGVKQGGGTGQAMQEVANAANEAASATGGIEDSANGAAKAATKAQKALMGFDEINKLGSNDEGGSGSGAGGSSIGDMGLGDVTGATTEISTVFDSIMPKIDRFKAKLQEVVELFKLGFTTGLGTDFTSSLSRTQGYLNGISKSLSAIGNNKGLQKAASELGTSFVQSFGMIAGAFTNIGATIVENLVGGLSRSLDENKGFITERLQGTFEAASSAVNTSGLFTSVISEILEVFRGDNATQITADLMSIITSVATGALQLAAELTNSLLTVITQPFAGNKDAIKSSIDSTFEPILTVLGTLKDSVNETIDNIFVMYEEKLQPMFQRLADGLSSLFGKILEVYNTYVLPVLDRLAEKFSEVWESHIQPMINKAIELIGKVGNLIGILWETVLAPLIGWLISTIVPAITPIYEFIVSTVLDIAAAVSDVIGGIIEAIGGMIDLIAGVLTLDWELAWEGIKSIFSGTMDALAGGLDLLYTKFETVWNGIAAVVKSIVNVIIGVVEGMANSIITGVNKVIDALNAIQVKVPDWVPGYGGRSFGFNLGKLSKISIPRLAEGGYLKANQPTLAMVGDNKTQGEIVSPEGKMMEVMMQALEAFFGKLMAAGVMRSNEEFGDLVIPIYLDGSMIDEVIITAQQRRSYRSGGR